MRTNLQSHSCCSDGRLVRKRGFVSQEEMPTLGQTRLLRGAVACSTFGEAVID